MTDHAQNQLASTQATGFIAQAQSQFINSEWRDGGERIPVYNPATGEQITAIGTATVADVDAAVAAARAAFDNPNWRNMAPTARARLLNRFADLIERDAALLAELEMLDNGMPSMLANHMELPFSVELIRYYAGWVTKIHGDTIPTAPGVLQGAMALTYTRREAIGVVAQIVPWNLPLLMAVMKIAPALAAGCTIILKPAELTPLTALYLAKLSLEAGFPPGVLNVVNGYGHVVGAQLAAHPGVDKIAFTGSTEVGRSILMAAAGNLKKVSLELGGKSPIIIFPDADLDLAIPGAAMSTFLFQGQNCMAGTRVFVHRKVYDAVVGGIAAIAANLKIGTPQDADTVIGPLISAKQKARVMDYIGIGQEEGAKLVAGGKSVGDRGFFVQPTLFADTNGTMRIVREEIFGPVISAQVFGDEDLDELGARVNDTIYGLSGSVWTTDLSKAHRMAHIVRAGQVSINCHGAVDVNTPFGGYKQSGWGREFGAGALDLYTETKTITARL